MEMCQMGDSKFFVFLLLFFLLFFKHNDRGWSREHGKPAICIRRITQLKSLLTLKSFPLIREKDVVCEEYRVTVFLQVRLVAIHVVGRLMKYQS